jgi:hypothetical protein
VAKRRSEQHIYFPWERRAGLLRRIRFDQARPFIFAAAAIALVGWVGTRERRAAGIRRTRATILNVRTAVDSYMADHDGGCPPAGFSSLGNYGNFDEVPVDAWGKSLSLTCPGHENSRYELYSDGPDGKHAGLDRIE